MHCDVLRHSGRDTSPIRSNSLPGWKRRGWKTADRQPVKNVDLWQRLEAALTAHQVEWEWVRGHDGHPENERVDQLARRAIRRPESTAT